MKKTFLTGATAIAILIGASCTARAQSAAPSDSWNSAALGINSSSAAAGNAAAAGACNATVQQQIKKAEQQSIAAQTTHAAGHFPFMQDNYGVTSCLSNLLGGNLSMIFEPPSLSGILNSLASQVCSIAQNYESQAIAPLAQGLDASIPSYEIIPGVSTGSIGTGMYINPSLGGGSGTSDPVQVNVTPLLGSNSFSYDPQFSSGIFQ